MPKRFSTLSRLSQKNNELLTARKIHEHIIIKYNVTDYEKKLLLSIMRQKRVNISN